jgi:lipocalin
LNADGTVKVDNSCNQADSVHGKLQEIVGVAKVPDKSEPAKLQVRFSKLSPYAPYWVIGGDSAEEEYVLVWSCTDVVVTRFEVAWILSRTPTLPAATLKKALAEVQSMTGVDSSKLHMTTQEGCSYAN